ncbi:MAG: relaxase domain-containing protein [Planctomycetes bacterium]|nr:relaxase domain-containing protein [Planctomycetota bacterium]
MLWFSIIDNAAGAAKYFTPEGRDYHVEDERTYAFFGGKGAEKLGLGDFDLEQFKRMLYGLHPSTGEKLTVGARKETNRCGYEVIFDSPKDVSMLWAFGDRRIPGVMEQALRETLDVIEEDAKARVRVGKADHDRVTGNTTYAAVLHTLAREENGKVDMHLHYHVLLPNATWDEDEKKWKALQLQAWDRNGEKLDRPRYVEIYHAQLRDHLHRLGYETETTKDAFRIVGIDDEDRTQFSQRHNKVKEKEREIEERIRKEKENPDYTLSPAQKSKLAAIYREPKKPGRSMDSLTQHWKSRVTPKQHAALNRVIKEADVPLSVEDRTAEAVTYALDHTTTRESRPDQRKVVLDALRFGRGNVTYPAVMKELGRAGVHRQKFGDHVEVTTTAVAEEERGIIAFAALGRGKCQPFAVRPTREVNKPVVQRLAAYFDRMPTAGQLHAARHVMMSKDRVMVWIGKGGAGKSTALKAVQRMLDAPLQVVAPTVGASRDGDLKKDFPDVDTVAAFLRDEDRQQKLRGGLLVIDEITMLGTRDFARVSQSANSHGYRILVVGDDKQHLAPVRGNVLGLLKDRAGLPAAEMNEILRQKGRYLSATAAASRHDVLRALDIIEDLGWVKEGNAADMIGASADTYLACLKAGESAVICSPTHKQGAKVVEAVRERMRSAELLGGEDKQFKQLIPLHYTEPQLREAKKKPEPGVVYQRYDAYLPSTVKFAVGDLIQLTGGGKGRDGKDLENGAVYRIDSFKENGDIVGLAADGKTARVIGADFGKFRHAYYATSLGVQSKTRDVTIMPLTADAYPAMGARQFNVDLGRGSKKAVVLTDSLDAVRKVIPRVDERNHAIDLVRVQSTGIRRRLHRHVAQLRSLANRVMTKANELVHHQELSNGRE